MARSVEAVNLRADNAQLRKQVLAYQQDLAMCRRVLQWLAKNVHGREGFVALRAVVEMKQR